MWYCGFNRNSQGELSFKGDSFDTYHSSYVRSDCVRKFIETIASRHEQLYSITDTQFNDYNFSLTMENIIKNGRRLK